MNRTNLRDIIFRGARNSGKDVVHYSLPKSTIVDLMLAKLLPKPKEESIISAKKAKDLFKKITGEGKKD